MSLTDEAVRMQSLWSEHGALGLSGDQAVADQNADALDRLLVGTRLEGCGIEVHNAAASYAVGSVKHLQERGLTGDFETLAHIIKGVAAVAIALGARYEAGV